MSARALMASEIRALLIRGSPLLLVALTHCSSSHVCTPNIVTTCLQRVVDLNHCSGDTSSNPSPPNSTEKTCCDPSQGYTTYLAAVSTDVNLCSLCEPTICPNTAATIGNASSAALAAAASLNATTSLVGKATVAVSGNTGSNSGSLTAAASAGGSQQSFGPPSPSLNAALPPTLGGNQPGGAGIGSSPVGGGGSGSSNLLEWGTISSTPQPSPSVSPSSFGGTSVSYAASSAGAGGAPGALSRLFGYGGSSSPAGGTNSLASFGDSSGRVLRDTDPADYFTRLSPDADLFQIIHSRYLTIDRNWVHSRAITH